MKINISDILDVENVRLPESSISIESDNELTNRIKSDVMSRLVVNKKKKPRRIGRLIAIVAVFAVVISSISVGAMSYFKPDNAINSMIEYSSSVDYSTLGTDVKQTASSNGLDFYLDQVLCDNNIMHFAIKCPKYNGRYVQPDVYIVSDDDYEYHLKFLINGEENCSSENTFTGADFVRDVTYKKDYFYVTYSGIKDLKDNSKVELSFDRLVYFDAADDNDTCDIRGNWKFEFKINRSKTRKKLEVNDLSFDNGENYKIKNFTISPLGFRFDYKLTYSGKAKSTNTLSSKNLANGISGYANVYVTMKDGTVYTNGDPDITLDTSVTAMSSKGESFETGDFEAIFSKAINVDEIKSIKIIDNIIYEV